MPVLCQGQRVILQVQYVLLVPLVGLRHLFDQGLILKLGKLLASLSKFGGGRNLVILVSGNSVEFMPISVTSITLKCSYRPLKLTSTPNIE